MNEALRILDRLLKKRGYSIKRHPQYNLLPLKNFNNLEAQKKVYESFSSNKDFECDNTDKIEIYLRTCINEKRTRGIHSELTKVSLEEHLIRCIHSLVLAVNHAADNGLKISLVIFDDRSDQDVLDKLNQLCDKLKCEWLIKTTKETGQGASLHEHFAYAKDREALIYFCEDDYLHVSSAISEMVYFYRKVYKETGSHILIHPQEHELIYSQYYYPSYILRGENRRWRTISNATHTFLTHSNVVKQYWQYFENTKYVGIKEKRHLGSEKKTTNYLFNHIPGFSPIPAVAVHLQSEESLPPFFDWKPLWEQSK